MITVTMTTKVPNQNQIITIKHHYFSSLIYFILKGWSCESRGAVEGAVLSFGSILMIFNGVITFDADGSAAPDYISWTANNIKKKEWKPLFANKSNIDDFWSKHLRSEHCSTQLITLCGSVVEITFGYVLQTVKQSKSIYFCILQNCDASQRCTPPQTLNDSQAYKACRLVIALAYNLYQPVKEGNLWDLVLHMNTKSTT